jgi:addiction module RelE/StbE family toxin
MGKITVKPDNITIIWADRAQKDLQEIVQYARQNSLAAARKLAGQISEKTTRLESFPESGRHLPEFPNLPYREIIVGNYRVIYIYKKDTVSILTVRHSKRQIQREDLPSKQS